MNLQVANFQRGDHVSLVQSHKLVRMSGIYCQVCEFSTSGCVGVFCFVLFCNLPYSTVLSTGVVAQSLSRV